MSIFYVFCNKRWHQNLQQSPWKPMIAKVPNLMPWHGKSLQNNFQDSDSVYTVKHINSPSQFKHWSFTRGKSRPGSRTIFHQNNNIINIQIFLPLDLTFFSIPLKNWNIVMLAGGLDMPKAIQMPFSS